MTSLQIRLMLVILVVGGAFLALKTRSDLDRAEAPVEARAQETVRAAVLETGPRVARAYATGREDALTESLAPLLEAGGAREAAVVEATGTVVALAPPGTQGADAASTPLAEAFKLVGTPGEDGPRLALKGPILIAALPVRLEHGPPDPQLDGPPPPAPGAGFLLARFDFSSALSAARARALRANLILGFGLLAIMVAVALVTWLSIGRSVVRIAKTIDRFDLGERAARTGNKRGTLGRIASSFDAMADRLQAHEEDLIEARHRLELTLKCVPVGVMVVRRDDGRPVYGNPRRKGLL